MDDMLYCVILDIFGYEQFFILGIFVNYEDAQKYSDSDELISKVQKIVDKNSRIAGIVEKFAESNIKPLHVKIISFSPVADSTDNEKCIMECKFY